jgi:hypothetical protein
MKTIKRKPVAPKAGSSTAENASKEPPELENNDFTEREKPNRISFNVTPEGLPDWERMLPKTKAQLAELLSSKPVQDVLGISREQAEKTAETVFGEDEANALLDLLGGIDSFAASRIYKVPSEVTSVAFSFSADHRKKINPPLTRVLNKWGPAIIKSWKDEIGLAIVLVAVLNTQVRLMYILEEKRKKGMPRPVTPITEAKPEPVETEPLKM